ncbi:MAG: ISL3 family transposase [Sphaerochaetaceae bacterium]|nr:ISL3 family transposase [Sphaerochaetaceae bacterium]
MPKYCLQNIKISLPCEPFNQYKNEVIDDVLHIYFRPTTDAGVCPFCKQKRTVHKWRTIALRAQNVGPHETYWHVDHRVLRCDNCYDYFTEKIPFRFGGTHCTADLAKEICESFDAQNVNVKHKAKEYNMSCYQIKSIHKSYLKQIKEAAPEPEPPELCSVDEFSIEKNHSYATMVIDTIRKVPLYFHKGNAAEDLVPFFSQFSEKFYKKIKAFSMDQNASYNVVVKKYLPGCKRVCDYFHMIKNYNDGVMDRVRARTYRNFRLEGNYEAAERLKHANRLINKKFPENIESEEDWNAKLMLQTMMEENHDLDVCIHMKESLQLLYDKCRDREEMRKGWENWCKMANESRIPELIRFARNKIRWTDEIVNHADYPVSSGVIEGFMNKIKVLKRVAFGYRDFEYFFMRIWQMFLPQELNIKLSNVVWSKYQIFLGGNTNGIEGISS